MGEIIAIKRTTPYGVQLMDGSYEKVTPQVKTFISKMLPAEFTIEDRDDKGVISRLTISKMLAPPNPIPAAAMVGKPAQETRGREADKVPLMLTSYIKDIVVAILNNEMRNKTMRDLEDIWTEAAKVVFEGYKKLEIAHGVS